MRTWELRQTPSGWTLSFRGERVDLTFRVWDTFALAREVARGRMHPGDRLTVHNLVSAP